MSPTFSKVSRILSEVTGSVGDVDKLSPKYPKVSPTLSEVSAKVSVRVDDTSGGIADNFKGVGDSSQSAGKDRSATLAKVSPTLRGCHRRFPEHFSEV